MNRKYFIAAIFALVALAAGSLSASAQFTISIPKMPKIKKDKPKSDSGNSSGSTDNGGSRSAEPRPAPPETYTPPQKKCEEDGMTRLFIKEANDEIEDLKSFEPGRGWLVRDKSYSPIWFAVSPSERNKRYGDENMRKFIECPALADAYDRLGQQAAITIPKFVPDKNEYRLAPPAVANLLKGSLKNQETLKVFHVGLGEPNWLINTNALGIPTARFKHGLVWARRTDADHPYCYIYYVNLVQDYAGAGTYGASRANYLSYTLAGCPAEK